MPAPRLPADLIQSAKDVRVEDIAAARGGLNLRRSGAQLIGPCPLCGGTDRFAINTKKQVWHCRGCVKGGDGIKLVQHLDGLRFPQAVEHLAGIRSTDSEPPPRAHVQRQQTTPQVSYVYQLEDGTTPYLRVNRNEDKSFFQQCWNGSAMGQRRARSPEDTVSPARTGPIPGCSGPDLRRREGRGQRHGPWRVHRDNQLRWGQELVART